MQDIKPLLVFAAVRTLTAQGFGMSLQVSGEITAQGRLNIVLPNRTLPAVNLYVVTPYRVQSAKTEAAVALLRQSFAEAAS